MPTLLNRISAEVGNMARRLSLSAATQPVVKRAYGKLTDFDIRDKMLDGSIYRTVAQGGARKYVLESIGLSPNDEVKFPIVGHVQPVPIIVDFYTNSFGGRLGAELPLVDNDGEDLDPRTLEVIAKLWRWSNLNTRLPEFTGLSANQGTVGLRVVNTGSRVYVDFDGPQLIDAVELDARQNVQFVRLKYQTVSVESGEEVTREVVETMSRDDFSLIVDGEEQLNDANRENALGLVPYVLHRHALAPGRGEVFGRHAYDGSEQTIHAINFTLTQTDESVSAHVWPFIFTTSAAKAPSKLTLGKFTMAHSQQRQGDPQPTAEMMVPAVPYGDIVGTLAQRVDWLRERQPQMILNSLKLVGGVSGEALARMLKAAEAESLRARGLFEDSMRRALQIGMSVGIASRIPGFDLGTGTGTKEAADRAYDDGEGLEAFAFADRPALPPTLQDKQQQITADHADDNAKLDLAKKAKDAGLPDAVVFDKLGLTEKQRNAIIEARTNDATLAGRRGEVA